MSRLLFSVLLLSLLACGQDRDATDAVTQVRFVTIPATGSGSGEHSADACVRDLRTGLVWELKSEAQGLHDWRNTYSWYAPDESHDELDYRGTAGGGECAGSTCDTWSFANAASAEGYCGFTDWRVPSRDELFSISELRRSDNPPTIDIDFFPLTQTGEYWSANDYSFQPESAWAWNFLYGHDRVDWKKAPKPVRLVRGTATGLTAVKD